MNMKTIVLVGALVTALVSGHPAAADPAGSVPPALSTGPATAVPLGADELVALRAREAQVPGLRDRTGAGCRWTRTWDDHLQRYQTGRECHSPLLYMVYGGGLGAFMANPYFVEGGAAGALIGLLIYNEGGYK